LRDVFLGVGSMKAALPSPDVMVDFADTFLDAAHVVASFPTSQLTFDKSSLPPYKVSQNGNAVSVVSYSRLDCGPFPEDEPKRNKIRFTPRQVESIGSGAREGLTLVVGPPGTGKTDVTVQIVSLIYRQNPDQRVLLLTHSNAALNQLFSKLVELDFDTTRLLRMGHGESQLDSDENDHSFSQHGRINALLALRLERLAAVEHLARSLGLAADAGYSCASAKTFYEQEIVPRWHSYLQQVIIPYVVFFL
jgi:intron-binding protein aquarius